LTGDELRLQGQRAFPIAAMGLAVIRDRPEFAGTDATPTEARWEEQAVIDFPILPTLPRNIAREDGEEA